MLFSAQRFLEDFFRASGLTDPDQYAVSLANLYYQRRYDCSKKAFLSLMQKTKTAFFRTNSLDRAAFEERALSALDQRFKKKLQGNPHGGYERTLRPAIAAEVKIIRKAARRTMGMLLDSYKRGVESLGIDQFWISRTANRLKPQPEAIARDTLAVMLNGILEGRGITFREVGSGIGWIDVAVLRASGSRVIAHIVELKILKAGELKGAAQLHKYLNNANRKDGWLVVVDAREPRKKRPLPSQVHLEDGCVARVIVVDINPPVPSSI